MVKHSFYKAFQKWQTRIPLWALLVFLFLGQLLCVAGLVGFLSYRSAQYSVNELANQLMQRVSTQVSGQLNEFLQAPRELVELHLAAVEDGELDLDDFDALEKDFFRYVSVFETVVNIEFGNTQGETLGVGRDNQAVFQIPRSMVVWEKRGDRTQPRRFYRLNEQRQRSAVLHTTPNFDARKQIWYQNAVKAGHLTWTPIFQPVNFNLAMIAAVAPVYQDGLFKGVVESFFLLADISDFLHGLQFSPSGQSFILEPSGVMVATSTQEQPFTLDASQENKMIPLEAINSQDEVTRLATQALYQQWTDLNTISDNQRFEFRDRQRQRYLGQVTPFRLDEQRQWLQVTLVPEADFMAQINANNRRTLQLGGLTLLGSMLLSVATARFVTQPLQRLQNAAKALSTGNLNYPIPRQGVKEVAQLSQSFREMAHQLNDSFQSLQASEQRFFTLLSNVPVGISIFDASGKLVLMNQAGETILGRKANSDLSLEQMPEVFQVYVAGTDQLYPTDRLPAVLSLQGFSRLITDVEIAAHGRRIPLEVSTIPVYDEQGQIAYAINVFEDVTERRQAEQLRARYAEDLQRQVQEQSEALYRSEERFRLAVKHAPDMFVIYDCDRRFLYVNEAGQRRAGLSLEELMGKRDEEVFSEELTRQYLPVLEATIASQTLQHHEFSVALEGQAISAFIVKFVPLLDDQGGIQQILGITVDVSDLKAAEEALRESEEQFRQIMENLPIMFGLRTLDYSRWLYINDVYEAITHRPLQTLLDDPGFWKTFTHPDDLPLDFVTSQNPKPALHQFRIFRPAGNLRWVRAIEFPVYNLAGKPYRVAVFAEDVTGQKQTEEALRLSEDLFRNAFDYAPIGMALVTLEGRFSRVNQMLTDVLGYSQAELLNLKIQDVAHSTDGESCFDPATLQPLLKDEIRHYQVEQGLLNKRGEILPFLLSISLVKDPEQKPLYFVAQFEDLSRRHEVDRVKDEFISIVSHELRTPLTAICGALGILDSGVLDDVPEDRQEFIGIALKNSDRLMRLVNDILTLERLESGRTPLAMEWCNVVSLVQQAFDSVQRIAQDANINLATDLEPVTLWGSPDGLVQTLVNLISNAIKFSSQGGTIWISVKMQQPTDVAQPAVVFAVKDHGRGIPPDKLESIFGRFQQVDASDARERGGTGLGLSICKTIVQQHRGQIWVKSVVGEGSTFYFTIPIPGSMPSPFF